MSKLTATEVAYKIGKSVYTLKRWYAWYEQLTSEQLTNYINNGMPTLPDYETIGTTKWRYWEESDIAQIEKFRDWMPTTRAGIIGDFKKKKKEGK